ncbi:peptidase domain-containing ABC transporter [Labrys sp. KB_33_2]|uniref:peptidase domain-containing ABC transporter n=1 Tax=Labrys sp. KB_33_2 TaxID=3237479 RepID=UPI003F92FA91
MSVTHTFLNISGLRRLRLVRQAEASECGLACLAMIAGWHGYDTDLMALRQRFPTSLKGMTLKDLLQVASRIGLGGRALRCELNELSKLRVPCILHWEFKHFVVLRKVKGDRAWLYDPANGVRVMSLKEISPLFTGVAIEFSPTTGFDRKRDRNPLKLSSLWKWGPSTLSTAAQGLALSVLLELFVLLTPFYMQLVIDEAIQKRDVDLLVGLAVAFGLLAAFNAITGVLRSFVFQYLANVLSFDMGARLFHHLVHLKLEFFQKRSLGDLLQRFHALEPIKSFILSGGITAIIDGTLAIFTGILMMVYSVKLGLIAMAVFLVYVALKFGVMPYARRLQTDAMITSATEQSKFLETIRAIQTIKIFGGESSQEAVWRNLYADNVNAGIRSGNLNIAYSGLSSLLGGLSDVLLLYLAARMVIDGDITVGIITAFMAYKGQFTGKLTSLIDQAVAYRMLDVPLDRVSEIALAEREANSGDTILMDASIGDIVLKNIHFGYSPVEPPLLNDLSLQLPAGSFTAIVGASGAGKSTLLKLILGLYEPTGGEVLVNGRAIPALGTSTFRRQLGVVMQEEQLLAGTLAENIALFDEKIDMDRVRLCAQSAAIDAEIMNLPMQYNSYVGDMGSILSSGQKQRVLIARALYRNPQILVMDEGTAHLDPERAEQIHAMLKGLSITRVVVAHNVAMMQAATRIMELREGRLWEVSIDQHGNVVDRDLRSELLPQN